MTAAVVDNDATGASRAGLAAPARVAALCVVGVALLWVAAALIPAPHRADADALQVFLELGRPRVNRWASSLTRLLDPLPFVVLSFLVLAVALGRRRPQVALAGLAVLALAPLSCEALKPLLAHTHIQLGFAPRVPPASFPSGHATAALALALCAVLVAPSRLRIAVAVLGSAFAVATGCSQLILGRHMPSDVLAGYLLAMLWMALVILALRVRS